MTYTSLSFALLVAVLYVIYYVFPKKYQWVVLLGGSAFFYVFITKFYALFILATILTIFLSANAIQRITDNTDATVKSNKGTWTKEERKAYRKNQEKRSLVILIATLVFNFGVLFIIKYFGASLGGILLPLGISFYTFQSTGYLIDVYRGNVEAEKNPFKLALFISFFPQILQGPIGEFDKLHHQLTEEHSLKWLDFKLGIQMIVWGLFKKLIVADRAVSIINAFLENGGTESYPHEGPYGGTTVLFVVLVYALQLYADFSGGIEISRGVSRLFGIDLAVNFRRPYFAKTLNEYWRRWHITLGAWMKKYIFYSLAASPLFLKLGRNISAKGSKHVGKTLPAALATFVVFIFVGIWHGSDTKYLAFGIWNGAVMGIAMLLEPNFISIREKLHIREDAWGHKLFQMVRTFILVLIGYYFDVATSLSHAMEMLRDTIFNQSISVFLSEWRSLGFRKLEYLIIIIGALIILYFSIRMEKKQKDSPGELLEERHGVIQWIVIFAALIAILILGIYGPGYDPADFVYMQF